MRFSRVLLASLLGLLGWAVDVDAHARLASPMPWNTQPSTRQVCGLQGTGANPLNPANFVVSTVNAAQPLVVQWVVVAADGAGPLTARLDTTAKTNPTAADFKVTLTSTGTNNPRAVSATPYRITFQIPAGTTCTGAGGTCTLRVASSSNWVACATIRLTGTTAGAGTGATAAPTPIPATISPSITNPPPTTTAPVYAPGVGSGGTGGVTGAYIIYPNSPLSTSGLQYRISTMTPVANRPQGLLLFLHGSTASNYVNGLGMFAQVAQQYDMIRVSVLAPNGQGWNEGGVAAQQQAATMLNTLIQKDLLTKYNIDTSKIFLTGQSSGAGFLSQYFVPMFAQNIAGGGAFFQCGAAAPNVAFQPTAATRANFKVHFEITTGDTIWPASYARSLAAYTQAGMSISNTNTKPGGHCAFDQQQVVLDNIKRMLPQPIGGTTPPPFSIASGDDESFQTFAVEPSTETTCVVATGLTSCPKVNGQSVQILTTKNLQMVDIAAQEAIDFGLSSSDIMTTIPSQTCRDAYRDLMCATYFVPCKTTTAITCQSTCTKANQVCSFNTTLLDGQPGHDSLYDCTLPKYQQQYSDANGMCAGAPPAVLEGDSNGASSMAQPMMMVTLVLSFLGMIFH